MADIEKRGRVFWTRMWVGGREVRRSLRTSDRAEARRRAQALREELSRQAWDGHERRTYRQAVVLWHETAGGSIKPATLKRYRVSAKALEPHFGALWLDQVTRKAVGAFVKARKAQGATNATVRRDLTALSRILAVAVAHGWTDENPARAWDRSVIKERREAIRPPSLDEIEAVAAACPGHLAELVRFAALTGVRQEEAASLGWGEVDAKAGTVTLVRTKTGRPRVIRLFTPGGDARPVLDRLAISLRSPFVFWHGAGERYRQLAARFAAIVKAEGKRAEAEARPFRAFRFHDMRHAFAVRWLQSGGDLFALSRHLGHTSVSTTEGYLRWVLRSEDRITAEEPESGLETGT